MVKGITDARLEQVIDIARQLQVSDNVSACVNLCFRTGECSILVVGHCVEDAQKCVDVLLRMIDGSRIRRVLDKRLGKIDAKTDIEGIPITISGTDQCRRVVTPASKMVPETTGKMVEVIEDVVTWECGAEEIGAK